MSLGACGRAGPSKALCKGGGKWAQARPWPPRVLTPHSLFPRCFPHPLPDDAGSGWVAHLLLRSVAGSVCQPGASVRVEGHPSPAR